MKTNAWREAEAVHAELAKRAVASATAEAAATERALKRELALLETTLEDVMERDETAQQDAMARGVTDVTALQDAMARGVTDVTALPDAMERGNAPPGDRAACVPLSSEGATNAGREQEDGRLERRQQGQQERQQEGQQERRQEMQQEGQQSPRLREEEEHRSLQARGEQQVSHMLSHVACCTSRRGARGKRDVSRAFLRCSALLP